MSATRAEVRFELRLLPWGESSTDFVYRLAVVLPNEGEHVLPVNLTGPSPTPSLSHALTTLSHALTTLLQR